jgi:hypothetical protein
MSWVVFLIALIPAIGVVVVAEKTRSKGAFLVAALVAAGLGVLTGNPAYLGIDLLFVGFAIYVSWQITKTPIYRTPEEIAAAQEKAQLEQLKAEEAAAKRKKTITEFFQGALTLGAAAFLLYSKFWQPTVTRENAANATTHQQPQPTAAQPTHAAMKSEKAKRVNSKQSSTTTQRSAKKTSPAPNKPVEKCLELRDDQAMVHCLERAN